MVIKSNASSGGISSPFFKKNEEFCAVFEKYVASKGGKVKGTYNAWTYLALGKIDSPTKWDLMYKKSTFTSTGNLLIDSKTQNLLTLSEWSTKRIGTTNSEFVIRKRRRLDFIKLKLNRNLSSFRLSKKYVVQSKTANFDLLSRARLFDILESLFLSEEIYQVSLKNNLLKIELRSEKHHFEVLDNLLEMS